MLTRSGYSGPRKRVGIERRVGNLEMAIAPEDVLGLQEVAEALGIDDMTEAPPDVDRDGDERRDAPGPKSISRDMRGAFWSLPSSV